MCAYRLSGMTVCCQRQPMPVLPEKGFTKLDVNMRKFRMAELVRATHT